MRIRLNGNVHTLLFIIIGCCSRCIIIVFKNIGLLTALLRKYTAKGLKPHTSSRGLRAGPNTCLAMNKDISDEEQRQASGHSTGTSTELYVRMNRGLGVPVSLALALWSEVRKFVEPPTMDALDLSVDNIESLIDKLYIISLDEYKKGKKLCVVLRHATASLIMLHDMYVAEYSIKYQLPKKIIKSLVSLGWASNDDKASTKLTSWGNDIMERFITDNNMLPVNAEEKTVMQTITTQSTMINQLVIDFKKKDSKNRALKQKLDEQHQEQKRQRGMLQMLLEQNSAILSLMQQHLQQQQQQVPVGSVDLTNGTGTVNESSMVVAPPAPFPPAPAALAPAPPAPFPPAPVAVVVPVAEAATVIATSAATPPPSIPDPVATVNAPAIPLSLFLQQIQGYIPQDTANDLLNWDNIETDSSTKKLFLRTLMERLIQQRLFEGLQRFTDASPPSWIDNNNSGYFKNAMKLIDCVVTSDKQRFLTLTKNDFKTLENKQQILRCMLKRIEIRAFEHMAVLEQPKKVTKQARATLTGLGGRYGRWLEKQNPGSTSRSPSQRRINFNS